MAQDKVQDCPNYEEGALPDHRTLSQVASLGEGETGTSYMLYIIEVAPF